MLNKNLALLCLTILCCAHWGEAQAPKAADAKAAENSVWYNARRGDPVAMNQLGVWYYSGSKMPRDYDQAYQWWSRAALAQNNKAIANLGVCYQYGNGAERDSVAAIKLYLTAIQDGQDELMKQRKANTPASTFDDMLIGLCYAKGIGTMRDPAQAAQYYGYAADRGSVDGMIAAAEMLIQDNRPQEALRMLERAAKLGNARAAYLYGDMRLGNKGVAADKPVAVEYIRKAADSGLIEAQGALGALYFSGEAIGRDIDKALQYLQMGAQGGDAQSMWLYGQALRQAKDYENALFWLSMAAQAGYQTQLQEMYSHTSSADPFKQYLKGCRTLAVMNNLQPALDAFQAVSHEKVNAGKVMEAVVMIGQGQTAKAAKALERLASTEPQAAYLLASLYLAGDGVDHDPNKAIRLYRQAANAGYGKAQVSLADIYYEGRLATADRREAARLYQKAFEQRRLSKQGVTRLLQMYADGTAAPAGLATVERLQAYDPVDPTVATLGKLR